MKKGRELKYWKHLLDKLGDLKCLSDDSIFSADEVLIELRYKKVEHPFEVKGKTLNYVCYGDEGEDVIYIKNSNKEWKKIGILSDRSTTTRNLCWKLFADNEKIKEISDKLVFVLHEMSENIVFGVVNGYNLKRIIEIQKEKMGHYVGFVWQKYLPMETRDELKFLSYSKTF